MNIGIDVSMLVYQGSGVATYTYNLVKNLLKIDNNNKYHLVYSSLRRPQSISKILDEYRLLGAKVVDLPVPPRGLNFIWNKMYLIPVEWFTGKLDVYHSSDFLRPPLLDGTRGVTTIHDLTWKKFPQFHTRDIIEGHARKLQKTIKFGDSIIVDSKKTLEDLNKYYKNIKNEIDLIPLGVEEKFFIKHSIEDIIQRINKYGVAKPYILYVGAIEPRKNLIVLIRAFAMMQAKYKKLNLVLAGRAGWKNEEVYEEVKKLNLFEKVTFTGYVKDEDLPYLYQGAEVFVYPSLYEGFGLPPLEAMASGTPTIAYNSPSISDSFVESIDPVILAGEIDLKMKNNKSPSIKIPSWQETARMTLKVLTQG